MIGGHYISFDDLVKLEFVIIAVTVSKTRLEMYVPKHTEVHLSEDIVIYY